MGLSYSSIMTATGAWFWLSVVMSSTNFSFKSI
jgi:hypothetical protein